MSLKSQKSLHEECSEIIERSYSVKTASNESLSCSDDEDYLAVELLHKLTPPVLAKLRPRFHGGGKPNDIDRRVEAVMRAAAAEEGIEFAATAPQATPPRERWIDEQGLVAALDHIFGNHKYSTHAHQLFQLLDPFHTGRATWSKLIDKLVQHGARHTRSRQEQWEEAKITRIKKFPHCKRETIVKLVPIQHAGTFCLVAVSRGGGAGVYDGELRLLASYQVFQHRGGNSGRVKNCWITDAIYMSDVQVLVYGSSDRRLAMFSARTPHHAPRETLCRLPAVPVCLAYTPSDVSGESELAFGTERGDIFRIRFLQPRVSLFYGNATDNTQDYVWTDLRTPAHASYTQVLSDRGVYARAVRRVLYVKDGEYLVSCSNDDLASITVRPLRVPAGSYVYSAPRGVSSFHCVPGSGILSGASADRVLLWRAPPPTPPAVLRARARLVDVAVHCPMRIVLAATVDAILYIWDLDEEVLLQTLKLKFPFLGVLGKRLEFGAYSIYPGPPEAPPQPSTFPPQCVSGAASPTPEDSENRAHWSSRRVEDDPEYLRFTPSTLLISCCGHVCVVRLRSGQGGEGRGGQGRVLPPPPHALPARAPEAWGQQWELPPPRSRRPSTPRSPPPAPLPAPLPAPPAPPLVAHPGTPREDATTLESTEHDDTDLDSLLRKAGLERILEKDFVLMQGLKHDLNKKLADMRINMKTQLLCARAPHLSLSLAPQLSLSLATAAAPPGVDLIAKHRHVVSLFPAGSAGATPATSVRGSPRQALS